MSEAGLNTVRTYALPPVELLEIAEEVGLRVLVGLDYYDWRLEPETSYWANKRIRHYGRQAVREAMELCASHPAVLGYGSNHDQRTWRGFERNRTQ
jgi:cytosine/adenosine deaminase-related metal-dependent hydrolase